MEEGRKTSQRRGEEKEEREVKKNRILKEIEKGISRRGEVRHKRVSKAYIAVGRATDEG